MKVQKLFNVIFGTIVLLFGQSALSQLSLMAENLMSNNVRQSVSSESDSQESEHSTILIEEDFSGFTAGSEEAPDGIKLVDAMGNFINPSILKPYSSKLGFKQWGGEGLYAAGGCIAIRDGWFLNTPAGDMSGEITLTFRARLTKDTDPKKGNTLELIFLSRKSLIDYERKTYTLTNEWQTFTYTSNRGDFEATGFQFLSNVNSGTILIDDIYLQSVKKAIAAPKALEAEDATEYSFNAVWTPVSEATKYFLSVYSKEKGDGEITVKEGFENISADGEGVINETSPNYPKDWIITWADPKKSHIAKNMTPDTGQSLRLIDEGDFVTTPFCEQGVSSIKFKLKAEASQKEIPFGSGIALSFDTDYGLYQFQVIDLSELLTEEAKINGVDINLTEHLAMFDKVYALKIEWLPTPGDQTTILLDNVEYTFIAPPKYTYLLKDNEVKATTSQEENVRYEVTGLDPNLDYYYVVKASNNEFTSESSKEVEVYTVSQPTALEATDITSESYTANWTSNRKVDFYRVEQIRQNTLSEDVKDYVILYEDFSKVTSEFKESDIAEGFIEQGEYTGATMPIDELTHIAGWKASSTQRVEGWLGGMGASGVKGKIAGSIVTPTLDLSHNDGECSVTLRAWGEENDWLAIQGLNAAAFAGIRFPKGGFIETTVTVPACSAKESLTFYSNNYRPFLIDYIKITQNVKAGEKVSVTTASLHTQDANVKSIVMTNPDFGVNHDIYYVVTGLRYRHGDKKDAVASKPSNLILVKDPNASAVLVPENTPQIFCVQDGIRLFVATSTLVNIYTISGELIVSSKISEGTSFISLESGIYLVSIGETTVKVVI